MQIIIETGNCKITRTARNLLRFLKDKFPQQIYIKQKSENFLIREKAKSSDIRMVLTPDTDIPCIICKTNPANPTLSPVFESLQEKAAEWGNFVLMLVPEKLDQSYSLRNFASSLNEYDTRKHHNSQDFTFKYHGNIIHIPLTDIIVFYKKDGKTYLTYSAETIEITGSIAQIKQKLKDDYFISPYKGYLVNIAYIKKINKIPVKNRVETKETLTLTNNMTIPICQNRRHEILIQIEHFSKL